MSSLGKPEKHAEFIVRLFIAFCLLHEIGILKVKAHTTEMTMETNGNAFADRAAKEGDLRPVEETLMLAILSDMSLEEFKKLQSQAEKRRWTALGAPQGPDDIWGLDAKDGK